MKFPEDLKYTQNDEWVRVEEAIGSTGVTDYAQDQLSDVVYVEITADIGATVAKGEMFGLIESVKAAADVYMPITGTLTEVNEALIDTPELVNSDPYGVAWMVKFEVTDAEELSELMDSVAYEKYVEERSG